MSGGWSEDFAPLVARLLEEEKSEQGRLISRRHGVTVHARKVGGTDAEMIRAVGTVEGMSAKELYQALWDVEERRKWDTGNSVEWHVVRSLDPDTDLHYMRLKGMFGMAERDFSDVRHKLQLPDGSYAILFRSIEHPEVPLQSPAVRAETIFAGQVIRSFGENSCKVTICNQTDIKGNIPPYLVNKAAARSPADWFNLVRAKAPDLSEIYGERSLGGSVDLPAVSPELASALPCAAELQAAGSVIEQQRLVADLERKLKRCDRPQLVRLLHTMAAAKASLLPVVAAGVAASAARRAETEELVQHMVQLWGQLQANSAERLMIEDAQKELGMHELIELSNTRIAEVLTHVVASLQGEGAEAGRFALLPVIEFNAEMHIQVNDYMEAIHLQALAKAHAIDSDIAVEPVSSTRPVGLMGRLSTWWSPSKGGTLEDTAQPPTTTPRPPAPEVRAGGGEVQGLGGEELGVIGLHSMQSVALRLNKKLELTSVKRLMRLSKYKAFSSEELTHVSNEHISSVLEQVKRVRDKLGDWELAQNVFHIVESSAELCLKVNDYAEAVNQETHRKMQQSVQ